MGGIENFFLDLGMNGKLVANRFHQVADFRFAAVLLDLLELLEGLIDLVLDVLSHQGRIATIGARRAHHQFEIGHGLSVERELS